MADNYRLDVVCDRREVFDAAIRLAFAQQYAKEKTKIEKFAVIDGSLILASYADDVRFQNLPMKMDAETSIIFAWAWLQEQEYKTEPDQDGSNKKGFWLTTTDAKDYSKTSIWQMPGGFHGAVVKISPEWCMYGK